MYYLRLQVKEILDIENPEASQDSKLLLTHHQVRHFDIYFHAGHFRVLADFLKSNFGLQR